MDRTNDGEVCHIQELPNEILSHIFSFLDLRQRLTATKVSKRWEALNKRVPWIDNSDIRWEAYEKDDWCEAVKAFGSRIRNVSIFDEYDPEDSPEYSEFSTMCLKRITSYCPNVVDLFYSSVSISATSMVDCCKTCTNLKSLFIATYPTQFLTDSDMKDLLVHTNLKSLFLFGFKGLNGSCFQYLPVGMQELNLGSLDDLRVIGPNRCRNLRKLCVTCCPTLEKTSLFQVLHNCSSSLEKFHFEDYKQSVLTESFSTALASCSKLTNINLSNGYFGAGVFRSIALRCKNLKKLTVCCYSADETDECFDFISRMPSLEQLRVNSCEHLTEHRLYKLRDCLLLKVVGLFRLNITYEPIMYILKHCKKLERLDVNFINRVNFEYISDAKEIGFTYDGGRLECFKRITN